MLSRDWQLLWVARPPLPYIRLCLLFSPSSPPILSSRNYALFISLSERSIRQGFLKGQESWSPGLRDPLFPIGKLPGTEDHLGVQAEPVASGLELQNIPSILGNAGPCTWATGFAVAGPLLWVVRGLLSGLLAEGQEEVCAQWLWKVHLQVRPHEQLEDVIANRLRRDKDGKVSGEK